MKTQHVAWTGEGFRFVGTDSSGQRATIDADGTGEGLTPSDMLPISLAACTAYDIVNILRKQRQDLRALEATIESEQDADPPWRYRSIGVHYVARGVVDQNKARKALALSEEKYCAVSATLRDVVDLRFSIEVVPFE